MKTKLIYFKDGCEIFAHQKIEVTQASWLLVHYFVRISNFPTSYTKDFNLALALKTTTTTEPKFDFIDTKVFAISYLFYLKNFFSRT
jgi:hypothetical protein